MQPRAALDAPGLMPAALNPGLPLDEGLPTALEDAGLPFRRPLDWKGLPVKLFLELTGLMLSRLLLEIDLPLLKEPMLSRPACMPLFICLNLLNTGLSLFILCISNVDNRDLAKQWSDESLQGS